MHDLLHSLSPEAADSSASRQGRWSRAGVKYFLFVLEKEVDLVHNVCVASFQNQPILHRPELNIVVLLVLLLESASVQFGFKTCPHRRRWSRHCRYILLMEMCDEAVDRNYRFR